MSSLRAPSSSFVSLVPLALFAFAACDKSERPSETTTSAANQSPQVPPGAPGTPVVPPEPVKPREPAVTFTGVGLSTPESVLHDADADVYLVSNVAGQPLAADGNGFVSRLSPEGKVLELKWIASGKDGVTLNAPKGLGLSGDRLYVADLDTVRMFDRKSGTPKGVVKVPGATFLNGITVAPDGRVLVSDTGMKAKGKEGMEPAGNDAVYAIEKDGKLVTLAKSKDLGNPNGLVTSADKTWVVTFGSGEIFPLAEGGKKGDGKKLPKGSLDGVVALPNGDLLVSSWDAKAIYRGRPGSDFAVVVEDVKAPADIGYDQKRGRVLVPLFEDDEVRAYDIR